MTITNVTDKERALSAEVQQLKEVLRQTLDLLDNVVDDPLCQHRIDDTIDAINNVLGETK